LELERPSWQWGGKYAIVELQHARHLSPGNVQAQRLLSPAYRRAGDAKRAAQFADTSPKRASRGRRSASDSCPDMANA